MMNLLVYLNVDFKNNVHYSQFYQMVHNQLLTFSQNYDF